MIQWNFSLASGPAVSTPHILLGSWLLSSTAQTACVLNPGDTAAEGKVAQDGEALKEIARALQRVDMAFLWVRVVPQVGRAGYPSCALNHAWFNRCIACSQPTFASHRRAESADPGPAMQALLHLLPNLFKYPGPGNTHNNQLDEDTETVLPPPVLPSNARSVQMIQWAQAQRSPVRSLAAHHTPAQEAAQQAAAQHAMPQSKVSRFAPSPLAQATAGVAGMAETSMPPTLLREGEHAAQPSSLHEEMQWKPQVPTDRPSAAHLGAGEADTAAARIERAGKRQRRESNLDGNLSTHYEHVDTPAMPPEVILTHMLQQQLSKQTILDQGDEEEQANRLGPDVGVEGCLTGGGRAMSGRGLGGMGVFPAPVVRQLCEELLCARSSGLVHEVPLPVVQELLAALHRTMERASHRALDADSTSSEVAEVTCCLDAAIASLYVLASPGMPPEAYREECVERVLGVFKYHLQSNMLALMDVRCARLWRPSLLREGDTAKGSKSASKGGRSAKAGIATGLAKGAASALVSRLEQATGLLSELMSRLQLGVGLLLPMLRIVLASLTVDGLAVYQVQASVLLASAFRCQPSLRQPLLDELHSSVFPLLYPSGARAPPRHLLVPGATAGSNLSIQTCVGLVLQLVQCVSELPDAGADVASTYKQCHQHLHCIEYFWNGMLNGLQGTRAAKADTSMDGRAFWEAFLQDLMTVQNLPEWPAATQLLTRFVTMIKSDRGVQHSDPYVRQLCLELLGQVAARIVREHKQAEGEAAQVQELAKEAATARAAGEEVGEQVTHCEQEEAGDGNKEQQEERGLPAGAAALLQQLLLRHLLATSKDGRQDSAVTYIASNLLRERLTEDARAALARTGRDTAKTKDGVLLLQQHTVSQLVIMHRALLDPALARQAATAAPAAIGSLKANPRSSTGDGPSFTPHTSVDARLQLPPTSSSCPSASNFSTSIKRAKALPGDVAELAHISVPAGEMWRLPLLTRQQAVAVCRWLLVRSNLGRARAGMLCWLVDAGDRSKQDGSAAQVRAKAVKALGHAVDEDVRVLGLHEVQKAVEGALQDDSVLVREAAVDLVGRYIARSRDLATTYFPVVSAASMDVGLSVRKRALKVLWDCCVRCSGFPLLGEALMLILARAEDQEESMRKQAAALCAELWFTPGSALPGEDLLSAGITPPSDDPSALVLPNDRSPLSRATLLMGLCWAVQQRDGKANLPPSSDSSVVAMLRTILLPAPVTPQDAESVARCGAREVVAALVDHYLELHAGAGVEGAQVTAAVSPAVSSIKCLMTLAAVAVTDAGLLMPPGNAACYVRRLTPYLKDRAPPGASPEVSRLHNTRMLALLSTLLPVVSRLEQLDQQTADNMAHDLGELLRNSLLPTLVDKACQCLCGLVRLRPMLAVYVHGNAKRYYRNLERAIAAGHLEAKTAALCCRFLATLGLLCRSGARILDAAAAQQGETSIGAGSTSNSVKTTSTSVTNASGMGLTRSTSLVPAASGGGAAGGAGREGGGDTPVSSASCLSLFLAYLGLPELAGGTAKLRENAVLAMGNLFISCPALMVEHAAVMPVLEDVLTPSFIVSPNIPGLGSGLGAAPSQSAAGTSTVMGPEASVTGAAASCVFGQGRGEEEAGVDTSTGVPHRLWGAVGSSSELKVRVLTSLIDLLKDEEEAMQGRQAQATQALAAAGGSGSAAAVMSPALARTWAAAEAGGVQSGPAGGAGVGGGGGVGLISRVNGEGDGCSVTGSVVQRLWPRILALAREEPLPAQQQQQGQQGKSISEGREAQGKTKDKAKKDEKGKHEAPPDYPLPTLGSAVRRRVLELIEVVQRGGLTAPWQAVAPLVALTTDPDPVTAAGAARALKQCMDKHAEFVGGELSSGLAQAYLLQRSIWAAHHPSQPFGKMLPVSVSESLAGLWHVLQPLASLKSKALAALIRPFEDATNTAGTGALQSEPGLLWFCAWVACQLPMKRMDEPLTLVSAAAALIARRGEVVLAELKDALRAERGGAAGGAGGAEGRTDGQGRGQMEREAAAATAPAASATAGCALMSAQVAQLQRLGSVGGTAADSVHTAARTQILASSPWKSATTALTSMVPGRSNRLVAAVKAACAMSLLLLLKQYLTDAYRLQDERVAAFVTSQAPGKKTEAKATAVKDVKVICQLHVVQLEAFRDASPDGARKESKTLAYLLQQDALNGPCRSSHAPLSPCHAEGDARAVTEEAGQGEATWAKQDTTCVIASVGMATKKPRGRPKGSTTKTKAGSTAGTKGNKRATRGAKGKKRKRQDSDSDEEEEAAGVTGDEAQEK